jgi:hypothetical protein
MVNFTKKSRRATHGQSHLKINSNQHSTISVYIVLNKKKLQYIYGILNEKLKNKKYKKGKSFKVKRVIAWTPGSPRWCSGPSACSSSG